MVPIVYSHISFQFLLGPVRDRVVNHVRFQSFFFLCSKNAQKKASAGVLIGQCTIEGTLRCLKQTMQSKVQSITSSGVLSCVTHKTLSVQPLCLCSGLLKNVFTSHLRFSFIFSAKDASFDESSRSFL